MVQDGCYRRQLQTIRRVIVTCKTDLPTNPWLDLPSSRDFVLEKDLCVLRKKEYYNKISELHLEEPPGPFIGNPRTASVVLLSLNPGYVIDNLHPESKRFVIEAWVQAAKLPEDANFFPIDLSYLRTSKSCWWADRLEHLLTVVDREVVMKNLACIELFPYPTADFEKLRRKVPPLPSRDFSFALVKAAIRRGALMIIMRGYNLWLSSVGELDSPNVIRLANPRRPDITPPRLKPRRAGNMTSEEWMRVLRAFGSSEEPS
jgi:hypothetical protein